MSRAFVKEDVDPPERSGRKRSASGLPPGATNYITARGAAHLRGQLAELTKDASGNAERIAELRAILDSVTVVESPTEQSDNIAFGAKVTLRKSNGEQETYRIAGVEELELESDSISWISPLGRQLLAADLGGRVRLENGEVAEIVAVAYDQ